MKAKEYAAQYAAASDKLEEIRMIAGAFMLDLRDIIQQRNCQSDESVIAVLEEMDKKWRAMAAIETEILPDTWERLIRDQIPGAYRGWMQWRRLRKLQERIQKANEQGDEETADRLHRKAHE